MLRLNWLIFHDDISSTALVTGKKKRQRKCNLLQDNASSQSEWPSSRNLITNTVESVEKRNQRNPYPLLAGVQNSVSTMDISSEVSQKIENRATVWSIYTTLGHPQGVHTFTRQILAHLCLFLSTQNSKEMEPILMPISWWIDNENVVHINNRNFFSYKEKLIS